MATCRRHLNGMIEKSPPHDFLGGLPLLEMGWDQSPVDGNGMGWKLLCVVRGWDGMGWDGMGWETSSARMGWDGKLLVLGWDGMGNFWCWDWMGYDT